MQGPRVSEPQRQLDMQADRMHLGLVLCSVLVLGWVPSPQGLPLLPEPQYPTQENFDLDKCLGVWYDVAMASTCPNILRHRAISTLLMEADVTMGTIKTTKTGFWNGICKSMSADFELTTTPGRFFYHNEDWQLHMDVYVVHANYDEYAIVIMNNQRSSFNITAAKLYSRTMKVRDTVLADFRTMVEQLGISDDNIIVKEDKGKCVLEEQVTEQRPEPELLVVPRPRRSAEAEAVIVEETGSGMMPEFVDPKACEVEPDIGPCFGMQPRYFYNSSSMSCQLFNYGGCLGSQNNFVTERDCLQRCRTEAACRLPMVAVPCTGQPPVWAFDSQSGRCLAYKKDFCQGNGNKFYSQAECEEYCGVDKDEGDFLEAN